MIIRNGKPHYVRLNMMAPETHDHNIVVKVISKRVIVDCTTNDGRRNVRAIFVVADNTGCMDLDAHDDMMDLLVEGSIVALHNVKVKMSKGRMRLAFDKWSSVNQTIRQIRGEILTDPNFSQVAYEYVGNAGDVNE